LTRVLFDADNLEKLGSLGIAIYFVKSGLKGNGISPDSLYRLTAELTYARHAPACMATPAGYELASRKAPETYQFILNLLKSLRDDGIFNLASKRSPSTISSSMSYHRPNASAALTSAPSLESQRRQMP
jgi:hypothetical protein